MAKQLLMVGIAGITIALIMITVGISVYTQQNPSADESNIEATPPVTESVQTILAKT